MAHSARMDTRIAKRLLQKKKKLDEYRPLPPFTIQRLHKDLRVMLTYNSNAIEGNTLSLAETQMVLEYGMTVNGHPLREFLEAKNHAEAFDALTRLANKQINGDTVLMLHRLVMDKIDDRAGELRTVQVYIRGADFTPPPARDVPQYLQQWIRWLTSDDALRYEPVTRAAIAHQDFEAIHPFTDGNGRVGRLLLNLMLMQEGYPPALVLREWRVRYVQSLHSAHFDEYAPLVDLVGLADDVARYLGTHAHELALGLAGTTANRIGRRLRCLDEKLGSGGGRLADRLVRGGGAFDDRIAQRPSAAIKRHGRFRGAAI